MRPEDIYHRELRKCTNEPWTMMDLWTVLLVVLTIVGLVMLAVLDVGDWLLVSGVVLVSGAGMAGREVWTAYRDSRRLKKALRNGRGQ